VNSQQKIIQTPEDWGDDSLISISKQNTGKEGDLITPKAQNDVVVFLKQNTPSAAQCISKIISSVLADGIKVVPAKNGSRDMGQKKRLEQKIKDLSLMQISEEYLRSYLEHGDAYMHPVENIAGDDIVDLQVLNPYYTKIRVDSELLENTGIYKPALYQYNKPTTTGSSTSTGTQDKAVTYQIDEIIRWKRPSTIDPVYGMAPLEEEQATLLFGIRVLNFNLKFFQNSGKPPMVVHLNENTTPKEANAYRRYFDSNYKGANNAWETMISYGGTKVQELELPDQTAFMDLLTYVRVQACGLFEVPPSEVGVTDKSGLNNTETLHKDFIKINVNGKKKLLGKLINDQLVSEKLGITDWKIEYPMMDAVNEKQRIELNALGIASGQLSINDVNKRNNMDTIDEPWADERMIGDSKGIKGYVTLEDSLKIAPKLNDPNTQPSDFDSGRGDLDGRDKEPDSSMNE
jgi:HK97 family phage portal protein